MAKNNVRICPVCRRKIVEYKHGLTKIIVKGLSILYSAGGCARLDELNLTHSEFTNFQKLSYFGLALSRKPSNEWFITRKGLSFLQGHLAVSKFVFTENGIVRAISKKKIFITQVKDGAQFKIEWQEQAGEANLFDR